ncbi:hypothetical protein QR680_002883 [Steinernema hermaphroditum]|uniref:G-protein coupled receptors family 1 profile domain-containing protein n=1 Tax=Steinernema hermaphroditum TaxID=289476 RepID=A0AA39LIL0_9BILA|nr:hypothetical protein QR680_002883 [Steinernema hermaphroditum]
MSICASQPELWRLVDCVLALYLLPSVCCLGLLLNGACLWVFLHHRQHPLVPALSILCICDSMQLLLSMCVLFVPALHDYSGSPANGGLTQVAYFSTGLLAPLLLTANTASIWTICYISVKRYRVIANPFSEAFQRPKGLILSMIAFLALLFNASKWMEYEWDWNADYELYVHTRSALANNKYYRLLSDLVLYPACVYVIPFCLIIGLNLRTLCIINDHRMFSIGHKRRLARERRSGMLLMAIMILFISCHTGGLLIRFVDVKRYEERDWFIFAKDVINLLFNVNSLANPLLYFLFTKQFKDLTVRAKKKRQCSNGQNKIQTTILLDCMNGSVERCTNGPLPDKGSEGA